MRFDVIGLAMNPFVLMFITIALGLLFGKVKFGKFDFGTSGAMFVGLPIGWWIYRRRSMNPEIPAALDTRRLSRLWRATGAKSSIRISSRRP